VLEAASVSAARSASTPRQATSSARANDPDAATQERTPPDPDPSTWGPPIDESTESSEERWQRRPATLELQFGSTPYGYAVIAGSYSVLPFFAVEAGIGKSANGPELGGGLVAGGGLRLQVRALGGRMGAGVGYSWERDWKNSDLRRGHWEPAHWINFTISTEWRFEFGALIRPFIGYGKTLNSTECGGEGLNSISCSAARAYVGVGLGYAF
jgi:hypothetical protein